MFLLLTSNGMRSGIQNLGLHKFHAMMKIVMDSPLSILQSDLFF